jgi:hypothetical protein
MAYPTVSKTYGFQPVQRLDGLPYAGAIRQIPIAAGYATAILNGDTVQIDTTGTLVAQSTTNSGNSVGVFFRSGGGGVSITPPVCQHLQTQPTHTLWMIPTLCLRLLLLLLVLPLQQRLLVLWLVLTWLSLLT